VVDGEGVDLAAAAHRMEGQVEQIFGQPFDQRVITADVGQILWRG